MWVSIEVVPYENEVIFLPWKMAERLDDEVYISFGSKGTNANVEAWDSSRTAYGSDFKSPLKIGISSRLKNVLHIPESLVYRLKYNDSNIVIGPVIGLLLGSYNYMYNPRFMAKYSDRFGIYDNVGGLIYAFSPKSVNWKYNIAYGLYYNPIKREWQYGKFPLPSVIYRRDFHSDPDDIAKLIAVSKGRLFNSARFTKYEFYQYIKRDEDLKQYLQETEISENYEQVKAFIDRLGAVILKPVDLSRGRGICIIIKDGEHYRISDYRRKAPKEIDANGEDELKEYFEKNSMFFSRYLVQGYISLAKIDDDPFDIRVVMQKDSERQWKCSGIECRVANNKTLITNISRGGYALTIDEALDKAFPNSGSRENLKAQIDDLCKKLCTYLDKTGHHFAEFGMDIAVDEDKKLWVIEVNVFPSFKGFKKIDYKTYLKIRYTPMYYAANLAGFKETHN